MARYTVIFYLGDAAQEAFIPALTERLIREEKGSTADYSLRVLSASGGGSIRAYKDFIKKAKRHKNLSADLLIVGFDANCNGFAKRRKQLLEAAKDMPYPHVITAIPDPHIERWYLLDSQALANVAGVPLQAVPLTAKCDKNHYKNLLRTTFANQNVFPPLGGVEYGSLVARKMDLYASGTIDHALRDFIDSARSWLRQQAQ